MRKKDIKKNENIKDKRKCFLFSLGVIFLLTLIVYFLFFQNTKKIDSGEVEEDFFKCISKNSTLYLQKGCYYCALQKEILGEGIKYIKTIDCLVESEKCSQVYSIPTWVIDGKTFEGVQSLKKLKSISNC